jgi:type II secretory pathway pseudopilin PulG
VVRAKHRCKSEQALTLLELLMALATMSTLVGLALLGLQRTFEDLRLNQAARQVLLNLTELRTRALTENAARRMLYRTEHDIYQRQRVVGRTHEDEGPPVPLPAGVDLVECTAFGSAVTFRPRGNATTFGTILLRNAAGTERRVVVDIAGRVRVQR